jgi:hypothetical protein
LLSATVVPENYLQGLSKNTKSRKLQVRSGAILHTQTELSVKKREDGQA